MLTSHDGAAIDDQAGLLEGASPGSPGGLFHSLEDVAVRRPRLEAAIREWIEIKARMVSWRGRDHPVRRAFAVVGLGWLWSIVALVAGVWLLALLGVE